MTDRLGGFDMRVASGGSDPFVGRHVFSLLAAEALVSLFLLNTASFYLNNARVALVQFAFCVGALVLLRPVRISRLVPWGLFVLLGASFLLSHGLASGDGVAALSLLRLIECLLAVLFGFAVCHWMSADRQASLWLASAVALATAICFFVFVSVWMVLDDPYHFDWVYDPPLFVNIRNLGHCLAIGMVCGAWLFFSCHAFGKMSGWAVFLVSSAMLAWSGSRGSFMAALFGVALLGLVFSWRAYARLWGILLATLVMAFFLAALFPVADGSMGWLSALQRTRDVAGAEALGSGRWAMWKETAGFIAQRPWFGWGGDAFRVLMGWRKEIQPHNSLLQVLLEWGVVGAVSLLLLLGHLLSVALHRFWVVRVAARGSATLVSFGLGLALALSLLALSLVDGVFYHGTPMAFLAAAIGMMAARAFDAEEPR